MVNLVHEGVVHDVLDALLFGDLSKFISTGGIGEPFSRDGEEQSWMERALMQMLLKVLELMGSDQRMVEGLTGP